MLQDFGTVAAGKKADLIILNANPLEDISNTEAIEYVLFDGNVYKKDALDSMLSFVEKQSSSLLIYCKLLWQDIWL
jgi:adenine deaminase